MIFPARPTAVSRDVYAGCFVCSGSEPRWFGGNAQGVAARHHDATGHATWCDVAMSIRYGVEAPDPRQIDIEDSITAAAGSGSRPVPAPVPALTPAGATARRERPTAAPEAAHA